jgi:hypothetical protein
MPLFTSEYVFSDDYPTIEPSLKLDFANARALDPRITFTRASTATYVGRDGLIKTAGEDEARFDHDPTTGESLGLLIEESRTNIVSYSQEFNNAYWSKTGGGNPGTTVTANQAVAPDGTTTADYIDYTTATTASKLVERSFDNTPAGKTYTGSVWIKGTSGQTINLILDGSGVDVTGEQYTLDGTWQRLTITRTYGPTFSAAALFRFGVRPLGLSAGTANQVYAWGAQLEAGSFPTSYIPTSGSTATRGQEDVIITGTSFSSWYNQIEGTIYCSYKNNTTDFTIRKNVYSIVGSSSAIEIRSPNIGSNRLRFVFNANFNSNATQFSATLNQRKTGFSYDQTQHNGCIDGTLVTHAEGHSNDNTKNTLYIGNRTNGAIDWLNGTISQFTYYPKRLTNTQLQTLTQ